MNTKGIVSRRATIAQCIANVKSWDQGQKNRVLIICDQMDELYRLRSQCEVVKTNGAFAFIVENCFDKRKGDVSTNQIRAILN